MLLQPITVQFSKSTLKPSAYTLNVKITYADYYLRFHVERDF